MHCEAFWVVPALSSITSNAIEAFFFLDFDIFFINKYWLPLYGLIWKGGINQPK